ncbi:hypothetical protein PIB30_068685 [Stylosanthes scabra]|uniref:Uncharacterized protein n=1 Tax=Stylosanthes scabra TaxID=79078 RepID=A0ABU6YLS9_9FABA|nr:hypothetical protein [Stylosanthes scabra]
MPRRCLAKPRRNTNSANQVCTTPRLGPIKPRRGLMPSNHGPKFCKDFGHQMENFGLVTVTIIQTSIRFDPDLPYATEEEMLAIPRPMDVDADEDYLQYLEELQCHPEYSLVHSSQAFAQHPSNDAQS